MSRPRAFTLLELLVVIGTISVIAGVLVPVFTTAKSMAKKASCLTHFRVVSTAASMYLSDYDDVFQPVNYQPGQTPNSRTDRTWVQLLLPYTPSFRVFECPADDSDRPNPEATFDQDLVPGDLYSQYYTASMRSNVGYNFQYLAPIFQINGTWVARPISESQLEDPGAMMEFLDSVWTVANGNPSGGGNWLVSPPCRYQNVNGQTVDTIAEAIASGPTQLGVAPPLYTPMVGWEPQQDTSSVYGGVWPWHLDHTNVATVYGTARSLTIPQIAAGCDVQPEWTGNIYDRSVYAWSPD